jgi:uncharacterized protein YceK
MKKTFLILLLLGVTLVLSGCGHYWDSRSGHNHSHYNGCGHRGH